MLTSAMPDAPVSDDERQYPYSRRNVRILPLSMMLASLGFGLAWPFVPLMVRALGVERNLETWVGNMMLVFYVVSFVMNPIWGSVADHYGRKLMVLRATLGMGAAMVLTGFAQGPLAFAVLLTFVAVFNGASSASMALIVANTPPPRIGRALAYVQTGSLIGQTMGPVVGAVLASMVTRQHSLYWVAGGIMMLAGALVAAYVHEKKHVLPGRWRLQWLGPLRELLVVPRIAPLFTLSFLFSALWFGNIPVMSLYALDLMAAHPPDMGTEAGWLGAVALGLGVAGAIAMPVWGRYLDRHDPGRVLMFATVAAAAMQIPLIFAQTPLHLVLARAAFGVGAAAMQPAIIRLIKDHAPPHMDARAISYAASFQFIAMGLAPFCAGLIAPALGLRAYFAFTIVITVAGLVLWLRSAKRSA